MSSIVNIINSLINSQAGSIEFLEWIEYDGNQWVDTFLPNTGDYIFEDEIMPMQGPTAPGFDGYWIFGGRKNPNYSLGIFLPNATTGNYSPIVSYGGSSIRQSTGNMKQDQWAQLYYSRSAFRSTVNGIVFDYSFTGGNLVPEIYKTNILLGKNQVNYAGTGDDPRNMYGRRKETKIYDAVTMELIRHYKPAMVNGIAGLYEEVSQLFIKSGGPGNFIPGPAL